MKFSREVVFSQVLHADDIVLLHEIMEGICKFF